MIFKVGSKVRDRDMLSQYVGTVVMSETRYVVIEYYFTQIKYYYDPSRCDQMNTFPITDLTEVTPLELALR